MGGRPLTPAEETSSRVHGVFGGTLQSVIECCECGAASGRDEVFHDLSLEIAEASNIDDALSTFTPVEHLNGENRYCCDACSGKVYVTKRLGIRRAPNVLAFHLKRFVGEQKDGRDIKYPDKLDLTPYMFGAPDGTHTEYHLSGVVEHVGRSKERGHYVAHVKAGDGTWATKNDRYSDTISAEEAMDKQAYILLYSRVPRSRPENVLKLTKKTMAETNEVDRNESDIAMSDSGLSVTEGKQAAPVASNEDSESIAPVDSEASGSSSSEEEMKDALVDEEPKT